MLPTKSDIQNLIPLPWVWYRDWHTWADLSLLLLNLLCSIWNFTRPALLNHLAAGANALAVGFLLHSLVFRPLYESMSYHAEISLHHWGECIEKLKER